VFATPSRGTALRLASELADRWHGSHPEVANQIEGRAELVAASVAEVVRLSGLSMWVEQSYKQVRHALGWSVYQVSSDHAIRRPWLLACLAFSLCWWA
jgi:hypothetical protein